MSRRLDSPRRDPQLQPIDWWVKPLFIACGVAFIFICKYVP